MSATVVVLERGRGRIVRSVDARYPERSSLSSPKLAESSRSAQNRERNGRTRWNGIVMHNGRGVWDQNQHGSLRTRTRKGFSTNYHQSRFPNWPLRSASLNLTQQTSVQVDIVRILDIGKHWQC